MFGCGGPVQLSAGRPTAMITSPNYPSNYPHGIDCTWTVSAPANHRVQLQFIGDVFNIESHSRLVCFSSSGILCRWSGSVFINTIQFCLLPFSLAVNNPFCILVSSTSPITFLLAYQAFLTFIHPSIIFFSNQSWCNTCPNHFSVFVSVLSSVSFVLLHIAVLHHWFYVLTKISLAFFTRSTSYVLLMIWFLLTNCRLALFYK